MRWAGQVQDGGSDAARGGHFCSSSRRRRVGEPRDDTLDRGRSLGRRRSSKTNTGQCAGLLAHLLWWAGVECPIVTYTGRSSPVMCNALCGSLAGLPVCLCVCATFCCSSASQPARTVLVCAEFRRARLSVRLSIAYCCCCCCGVHLTRSCRCRCCRCCCCDFIFILTDWLHLTAARLQQCTCLGLICRQRELVRLVRSAIDSTWGIISRSIWPQKIGTSPATPTHTRRLCELIRRRPTGSIAVVVAAAADSVRLCSPQQRTNCPCVCLSVCLCECNGNSDDGSNNSEQTEQNRREPTETSERHRLTSWTN